MNETISLTKKSADTIARAIAELSANEERAMIMLARSGDGATLELGLTRQMYMQCLKECTMDIVRSDFRNRIQKIKDLEDIVMILPSSTPHKEVGFLMIYANKQGLWVIQRHPTLKFVKTTEDEARIFEAFTGMRSIR